MYRPKEWDSEKMHLDMLRANVDCMDGEAFIEAGADAMLGALKKEGVFTYGYHTPELEFKVVSGYWAFIEE